MNACQPPNEVHGKLQRENTTSLMAEKLLQARREREQRQITFLNAMRVRTTPASYQQIVTLCHDLSVGRKSKGEYSHAMTAILVQEDNRRQNYKFHQDSRMRPDTVRKFERLRVQVVAADFYTFFDEVYLKKFASGKINKEEYQAAWKLVLKQSWNVHYRAASYPDNGDPKRRK